jgi:hypothetical protein
LAHARAIPEKIFGLASVVADPPTKDDVPVRAEEMLALADEKNVGQTLEFCES